MSKFVFLTALTLAALGGEAAAQSNPLAQPNPSGIPSGEDQNEQWSWQASKSSAPTTWYAMVAVEQSIGPQGCDTFHYKVSTVEPIELKGPPEVRVAHADELAAWWMMYVRERAPIAYRWLTTSAGHEPPQMYFRKSAVEAVEAFREDGHLRKGRRCSGSKLVGLRTGGFDFTPPPGFARVDFGHEPVPQGVTVARQMNSAPGAR